MPGGRELVRVADWAPGELLYSLEARTQRDCVIGDPRAALWRLLGSRTVIPSADLPCHLLQAFGRFGQYAGFSSVEDLIARTTLYPYFTFFMPRLRTAQVLERARSGKGNGLKTFMGLVANRFGASVSLRYCERCARAYLRGFGDVPWLRSHQLPGVCVCWRHGEPLHALPKQSSMSHRQRLTTALAASGAVCLEPQSLRHAVRFANLSHSILQAGSIGRSGDRHAKAYWRALKHRDFTRGNKQIRWSALSQALLAGAVCSEDAALVGQLNLCAKEPPGWLRSLLGGRPTQAHPMCHLALIDVLFDSLSGFLDAQSDDDRALVEQIPALTPGDTAEIAGLIADASLSCRQVANTCGLSVSTIAKRRRQLGVPVSARPKTVTVHLVQSVQADLISGANPSEVARRHNLSSSSVYRILSSPALAATHKAKRFASARDAYRKQWLRKISKAPAARVADLRRTGGASYTWLRRHDPAWLDAHLPSRTLS